MRDRSVVAPALTAKRNRFTISPNPHERYGKWPVECGIHSVGWPTLKILKWILVVGAVIAVVAVIAHLRRDAIARDVANSILEERGFVATELEVDSLSPSRLALERLVIESESGARYEIDGLVLPLSVGEGKIDQLDAASLTVTYATERDKQRKLSTTLATVFELPVTLGGLKADIGNITLPGFPAIQNATMQLDYDGVMLSFTVDDIEVVAVLTKGREGSDVVTVAAHDGGDVNLNLDLTFVQDSDRYSANGDVSASLAAWLPTLMHLELVPAGLRGLDTEAGGSIAIQFDDTAAGHASATLQLDVSARSLATFTTESGRTSTFRLASMDTLAVEFNYPDNNWTAQSSSAGGVFSTDGLSDVPVEIDNLSCQNGITCTLTARVESQPVVWSDYTAAAATLSLPLTLETGDPMRVGIGAAASGEFSGLETDGLSAALVTITAFSGTDIVVDADWRCSIDELRLALDDLAATADLLVSPGVAFEDLEIGNSGATVAGQVSVSTPFDGHWHDVALSLPGATGTFSLRGEALSADVDIVDLGDAIAGNVRLQRDTATNSGNLVVSQGWLSFDRARLSDYIPGKRLPVDVLQGTWDIDLDLEWQAPSGIPEYRGSTRMTLDNIGGTYTDIAILGLSTKLAATIAPSTGLALSPSPVAIRLVDVGVPVENIAFDYAVDTSGQTLHVDSLSLDVFGGRVLADPFAYVLTAETNDITLRAQSIQLQLMVDTLEFESLELTGTISGELPVTMSGNSITIGDGKLQSDAGGGTIRYRSADAGFDSIAPAGGIGTVTQTLTNFEFESLSSTVDYVEGGNMRMLMRLVGVNPDLDPDQPYAFNLNLDNNIPQMLRSLRAVRSIEDILKQRTEN